MPTELEELVEFLHHGNTRIRQIATENLVGYSSSQASIFKVDQLRPIRDLKLLVRDYTQIAKNALTILINLSDDKEVLEDLSREGKADSQHDKDDAFLECLIQRITNPKEPNADLIAMLLANMAKSDATKRILTIQRKYGAVSGLSSSAMAMDQLMDCFVKGAEGSYNKDANFDYLSYFFADIAKHQEGRKYLLTEQKYDSVVPISKLVVFTEHSSLVRRKGVASTIKNVTFDLSAHPILLDTNSIDLLPYILLPITGPEDLSEEETLSLPEPLQLLPPDKQRDASTDIIITHLETLLILTTTKPVRETMRQLGVYPIIRELHLAIEHDEVREHVERLVGVLQRDEDDTTAEAEGDVGTAMVSGKGGFATIDSLEKAVVVVKGGDNTNNADQHNKDNDDDDDDKLVEII